MPLLKSARFLHSRKGGGCDTKTALPLFENQSIVEQPLDLWTLTEKYAKAAVTQILTARYLPYDYCFFLLLFIHSQLGDTDIGGTGGGNKMVEDFRYFKYFFRIFYNLAHSTCD